LLVVKGKAYNYTIPWASYSESFYGPIRRRLSVLFFRIFPFALFFTAAYAAAQ
jgi:hypothetical protein